MTYEYVSRSSSFVCDDSRYDGVDPAFEMRFSRDHQDIPDRMVSGDALSLQKEVVSLSHASLRPGSLSVPLRTSALLAHSSCLAFGYGLPPGMSLPYIQHRCVRSPAAHLSVLMISSSTLRP